jgi:hypothetical protein
LLNTAYEKFDKKDLDSINNTANMNEAASDDTLADESCNFIEPENNPQQCIVTVSQLLLLFQVCKHLDAGKTQKHHLQ